MRLTRRFRHTKGRDEAATTRSNAATATTQYAEPHARRLLQHGGHVHSTISQLAVCTVIYYVINNRSVGRRWWALAAGTYLERRGCMLEPVVRCNVRLSTFSSEQRRYSYLGGRLPLASSARGEECEAARGTQSKLAWAGQTRWHGARERRGGQAGTQQRQTTDTARTGEHGVAASRCKSLQAAASL